MVSTAFGSASSSVVGSRFGARSALDTDPLGAYRGSAATSRPFYTIGDMMAAQTTASGLQIEVLQEGSGQEAKPGQTVTVHYVGTLTNGSKFDSSRDRGQGFTFRLGAGQVIRGWDEGVAGMKVGELRKLTVPAALGYGVRGFPPVIPPNSTLVFEVELLRVG